MIAKVIIESPLPQLDRVFEYEIPEEILPDVSFGVRVKVSVGASKKLLDGYVVEVSEVADYQGKLSPLSEVVSPAAVLNREALQFLSEVSKRYVAPMGELLKLAIPNRSVAVEKAWLLNSQASHKTKAKANRKAKRQAWMVSPITKDGEPPWIKQLLEKAIELLVDGSVIVCLPDQSDVEDFLRAVEGQDLPLINLSSSQTASKRYASYLKCLNAEKQLMIGNRSSLFAPCIDLAGILVWEESNFSHIDQASPYLHSRDLALVRQASTECDLILASYGMSTEVARLVQIKYLDLVVSSFARPKVSYEQQMERAESLALNVIKTALTRGPVLVQVSALGHSVALYCKVCNQKVLCNTCSGPLWLNAKAQPECRWCHALNFAANCRDCGSTEIRQGRSGATRSVSEMGKMFPGIRVLEANSNSKIRAIDDKPVLVIATPGSEPIAQNGYAAVILMDASNQLARDSLRAVEDAVTAWNGAVSLLRVDGQAVLVGVGGKLAEQYVLWLQEEIAFSELRERVELGLPPTIRLGSISGNELNCKEVVEAAKFHGAEILGPTVIDDENVQYLFKFPYSNGIEIASALKAATLRVGAGLRGKTQRNQRLVRIKMDDRQVI